MTATGHKLTVARLPSTEAGDGRAFVDPDALSGAGINEGSVVELRTHRGRRSLARVAARPDDRGRGIVRLDRYQMRLLKPDRWFSIVFQHWDVSYFATILEAARAHGGQLKVAVTQDRDVITVERRAMRLGFGCRGRALLRFRLLERHFVLHSTFEERLLLERTL